MGDRDDLRIARVAQCLHLPAGVGGAWIGTSEFADAAGFAAAETFGGLAVTAPRGTSDQAVVAYTLIKVVGRDVWIGIWAFVLAIVATTQWERVETGRKPEAAEIWRRFPKFIIGFLVASLIVTLVTTRYSLADYNKTVVPALVGADQGFAQLGLHLLLPQHRTDHAVPRTGEGRDQAIPRLQRGRHRQRDYRFCPFGGCVRSALGKSGSLNPSEYRHAARFSIKNGDEFCRGTRSSSMLSVRQLPWRPQGFRGLAERSNQPEFGVRFGSIGRRHLYTA